MRQPLRPAKATLVSSQAATVTYKDISERIALLMQEIRDLQERNAQYCKGNGNSRNMNRTAHDARELRLQQIKEELSQMMRMRTDKRS